MTPTDLTPSSLRARLHAGPPAIGHFVFEFATPGIGYLARNAGADFVVFDLEHSGFTFESAKLAVLAGRAAGIPVVVRVPSHDSKDLARACDIGADGIMAPLVHNAEQARAIVAAVKYPPNGMRGVGMAQMHDRYRIGPFADKARAENGGNAVFLQIESGEGSRQCRLDRVGRWGGLPLGRSHGPVVFAWGTGPFRHARVRASDRPGDRSREARRHSGWSSCADRRRGRFAGGRRVRLPRAGNRHSVLPSGVEEGDR